MTYLLLILISRPPIIFFYGFTRGKWHSLGSDLRPTSSYHGFLGFNPRKYGSLLSRVKGALSVDILTRLRLGKP